MLEQRVHALDDLTEIGALVGRHPWATVVSAVGGGRSLEVSHAPLLLDAAGPDHLVVSGHLARADAHLHRLGEVETVLVVQGPYGYVTPTWYEEGTYVPTWNFVVAHLYGVVEVLDDEATWEILRRTVDRFEHERPEPWSLDTVTAYARDIAPGALAFRMRPTRIVGKAKLSQDKPPAVVERVVAALDVDPVHAAPDLAAAMRHHLAPEARTAPDGRDDR